MAIGGILENVEVTRQLDGVTFFAATVEEHPVDGVAVEREGEEGRVAEITLMSPTRPASGRGGADGARARRAQLEL